MNDIYLLYNMKDQNLRSKVGMFEDALKNGNFDDYEENKRKRLPECKIGSSDSARFNREDGSYYRAKEDCRNSKVLIAFFDAGFFHNEICCDFWHEFWEKQVGTSKEKNNIQIIFPVLLFEEEYKPNANAYPELFDIYSKANDLGFYHVPLDTSDKATIDKFFNDFVTYVRHSINILKDPKEDVNKNKFEQKVIVGSIENLDDKGKIDAKCIAGDILSGFSEKEKQGKVKLVDVITRYIKNHKTGENEDKAVVCAIYTGGTVGMIRDHSSGPSAFKNATPDELLQNLPRLGDLNFDVHLYSYDKPIDSSNADSGKWIQIARIISHLEKPYNGFVIIHGANTLAYTASALSYMFKRLDKPIILTGAELPLSDISREAETNVIRSLILASETSELKVPEVCILYGSQFMRGNRATKKIALDTVEGFHSPNFPNLGNITTDRKSVNHTLCREKANEFEIENIKSLKSNVAVWDVYPDMDTTAFSNYCNSGLLDALILRTYGTGGVPDEDNIFMGAIRNLIGKNTIVISLTQSPIGYVELRLHETNAQLFDIGVVNGGDMTTEAAYCKIKYLIALTLEKYNLSDKTQKAEKPTKLTDIFREEDIDDIGDKMMQNLKGELSMVTRLIRFPQEISISNTYEKIKSKEFYGFDKRNLQAAVLRIRGVVDTSDPSMTSNKVSIDVRIQKNGEPKNIGRWAQSRVESEKVKNINIDILDGVRRFLDVPPDVTESISIEIASTSGHILKYERLSIVLLFGGIV